MSDLTSKKCIPCEEGTPPLTKTEFTPLLKQLKLEWEVIEDKKIKHEFKFESYLNGLEFAQEVGKLAEEEDHHPNIHIYYKRVIINLSTHSIGGLSENDFVLAAKIESLS
ncbi:MAG: 4a-hydroxytetrahydrobiopterin dehydratase [Candidatus Daviesbacteria bacterium]|nr:4a-hydroxytetrahydrobiopterin dehydratase [Candidatus Daviesbacteria bacterium]